MASLLYPFVIALFLHYYSTVCKKTEPAPIFQKPLLDWKLFYRLGTDWLETILQFCIQLMHHPT